MFRIPVRVHPVFWVAALIATGGDGLVFSLRAEGLLLAALLMAGIFLVVLVHELGHAAVAAAFDLGPRIDLHALGGVTHLHRARIPIGQYAAVLAGGPAAGFLMWAALGWVAASLPSANPMGLIVPVRLGGVSFFWALLNLLPVLPLDAGHLLAEWAGPRRRRWVRRVGLVAALGAGIWAAVAGVPLITVICLVLAWQTWAGERRIPGGVVRCG